MGAAYLRLLRCY